MEARRAPARAATAGSGSPSASSPRAKLLLSGALALFSSAGVLGLLIGGSLERTNGVPRASRPPALAHEPQPATVAPSASLTGGLPAESEERELATLEEMRKGHRGRLWGGQGRESALGPDGEAALGHLRSAWEASAAFEWERARRESFLALTADPRMSAGDWRWIKEEWKAARFAESLGPEILRALGEKKPELEDLFDQTVKVSAATREALSYTIPCLEPPLREYCVRWGDLTIAQKLTVINGALLEQGWRGRIDWCAMVGAMPAPVALGMAGPLTRELERRLREASAAERRALSALRGEERLEEALAEAIRLRQAGRFEEGESLLRKLKMSPETPAGEEASRLLKDPLLAVRPLEGSAPPKTATTRRNRITFYLLGEGFRLDDREQRAFADAARRAWQALLAREPFREYSSFLERALVHLRTPGSSEKPWWPGAESPLDSRLVDGVFTGANYKVGNILSSIDTGHPWQAVVIGNFSFHSACTGGHGVSFIGMKSPRVLAHEVGHSLAGLHDEYDSPCRKSKSSPGWTPNLPGRPFPPNLAEGSDRRAVLRKVPWRRWLEGGPAVVWNGRPLGAFEGGYYTPRQVWRAQGDCCMRDAGQEFCVVCMEVLVKAIYRQVHPIDSIDPARPEVELRPGAPLSLEARVLRPRSHLLRTLWTADFEPLEGKARFVTAGTPRRQLLADVSVETLEIAGGEFAEPGVYRVTFEARDATPWVLRDEEGLLRQSWTWTVRVADPPPDSPRP